MPCQCDYMGDSPKTINSLGQMLCYLCGELTDRNMFEAVATDRLRRWWMEHQRKDRERVEPKLERLLRDGLEKSSLPPHDMIVRAAAEMIAKAEAVHPVSDFHKRWFAELASEIYTRLDQAREARRSALSKLSPEEREALGLPSE